MQCSVRKCNRCMRLGLWEKVSLITSTVGVLSLKTYTDLLISLGVHA